MHGLERMDFLPDYAMELRAAVSPKEMHPGCRNPADPSLLSILGVRKKEEDT